MVRRFPPDQEILKEKQTRTRFRFFSDPNVFELNQVKSPSEVLTSDLDPPGHRLDDVPAVRRHLVRRSSRGPTIYLTKDQTGSRTQLQVQQLQPDRTPHEVRD